MRDDEHNGYAQILSPTLTSFAVEERLGAGRSAFQQRSWSIEWRKSKCSAITRPYAIATGFRPAPKRFTTAELANDGRGKRAIRGTSKKKEVVEKLNYLRPVLLAYIK